MGIRVGSDVHEFKDLASVYISRDSLNFKLKLKNARGSSVNINGVSFSRALAFSVKNTFPMVLSPGDSVYLDFVFKPW
jgi:hypothetical protein